MNAQVALELPYYFHPRFSSSFIKLPSHGPRLSSAAVFITAALASVCKIFA
jgi:hypothetical protein